MKASTINTLYPPVPEKVRTSAWSALTDAMRQQPAWIATALPLVLTLIMGWLDFVTGWEVSLFIFYALPITLAVWWSGTMMGIFISIVSGVMWWLANESTHPYETELGYGWALINREFYFCVVVFAVTAVRNKQDADAARIRMLEERRQLERDIVCVSEHEQQRIGQDLHDGLCQHLAAIGCAAHALAEDLQARCVPEARDAVMIEDSVHEAVMEARNLARGIFPVHVDRSGLATALGDLARMTSRLTGAVIELKEETEAQLDSPEASMHLYRIAQEAVANAVRHGGAKQITIFLHITRSGLEMKIDDDGCGMNLGAPPGGDGMGLRTMRYRAEIMGAHLEIKPRPAGGTSVCCTLPLEPQSQRDHDQN